MITKHEDRMTVMTAAIDAKCKTMPGLPQFIQASLNKFRRGDWGTSLDKEMNDAAFKAWADEDQSAYDRTMGVYTFGSTTIWIIEEWGRSVTTILFPEDY